MFAIYISLLVLCLFAIHHLFAMLRDHKIANSRETLLPFIATLADDIAIEIAEGKCSWKVNHNHYATSVGRYVNGEFVDVCRLNERWPKIVYIIVGPVRYDLTRKEQRQINKFILAPLVDFEVARNSSSYRGKVAALNNITGSQNEN